MGEDSQDPELGTARVCWYDASGRLRCSSPPPPALSLLESDVEDAIDTLRSLPPDSPQQRLAVRMIQLLRDLPKQPSAGLTERIGATVTTLLQADRPVRSLLFVSDLKDEGKRDFPATSAY